MSLIPVRKTTKLFIGGQFVRSESGRSYMTKPELDFVENSTPNPASTFRVCAASIKDLRQAVEAASKVQKSWGAQTPYLRGQILYRIGEMLESKNHELHATLKAMGLESKPAENVVQQLIDLSVYYAGFADKYQQLASNLNPVAGAFHNFTAAEPVGVVTLMGGENNEVCLLFDALCAALCSGNTVVGVMNFQQSPLLPLWAEVCATADVPAGVVNLLSGDLLKLYECIGRHMQVQSVQYVANSQTSSSHKQMHEHLRRLASHDMKRVSAHSGHTKSLQNILAFVEYKTLWHPVGF